MVGNVHARDEPGRAATRKVLKDDGDIVGSLKILLPVLRHGLPLVRS